MLIISRHNLVNKTSILVICYQNTDCGRESDRGFSTFDFAIKMKFYDENEVISKSSNNINHCNKE